MFTTDPNNPVGGVSAVKALQIAASQGQRIYHISPTNQAQVLPNLHLDAQAMSEITTTLATGKEVIAHTDRISVPGWTREGYILFDPVTGAGAYKIAGGANGGFASFLNDALAKVTQLVATYSNTILAAIIAISAVLVLYMLALVGSGLVALALTVLISLLAFGAAIALDADSLVVAVTRLLVTFALLLWGPFELVVIPFLLAVLVLTAALIRLVLSDAAASSWRRRDEIFEVAAA